MNYNSKSYSFKSYELLILQKSNLGNMPAVIATDPELKAFNFSDIFQFQQVTICDSYSETKTRLNIAHCKHLTS